jgi:uncharacterized protein YejL (UPF0352 family)
MGFLSSLWLAISRALAPLSNSNISFWAVAFIALALIALLFFMPTVESAMARTSWGGGRNRLSSRMVRQAQALRPSRGRNFSDKVRENLYRDGQSSAPVETGSDFFLFTQFVFGSIALIIGFLVVLVGGASPIYLALAVAGYFAPTVLATVHNRNRRNAITKALPKALPRLATQIEMEPDLKTVFAKVAESDKGPLYDEFEWASGQMAIAARNVFEVLRELDRRNGLKPFFGPMADDAEREARGSDAKMKAAIRERIILALNDHYAKIDEKLGTVANRVTIAVAVPLMIGILISILGPLILSLVYNVGQTPVGGG